MHMFILAVCFVALWLTLYVVVLRPKLASFRLTSGIYARLDALEAGIWSRVKLWLNGLKVAIIGFVTSSAPLLAIAYERIGGLDWSQLVAGDKAKLIGTALAVVGVIGPMIMVALHNGALADASATEPQK